MTTSSPYHISVETMEQEKLVIEASKKDREAFRPIYEKYHEPIFRFIYQRIDDKESAFDITQQVFVKAITNLHKFEFRGLPFASWLYRIAKSEVFQAVKDNKANRSMNMDAESLQEILQETSDSNDFIQEKEKSLSGCMSQLQEAEVQIVEMRFFEDRAFKEIGEILAITENNAKVKLYRILDKLKKCLQSK